MVLLEPGAGRRADRTSGLGGKDERAQRGNGVKSTSKLTGKLRGLVPVARA
jgi:hypothetical protein